MDRSARSQSAPLIRVLLYHILSQPVTCSTAPGTSSALVRRRPPCRSGTSGSVLRSATGPGSAGTSPSASAWRTASCPPFRTCSTSTCRPIATGTSTGRPDSASPAPTARTVDREEQGQEVQDSAVDHWLSCVVHMYQCCQMAHSTAKKNIK